MATASLVHQRGQVRLALLHSGEATHFLWKEGMYPVDTEVVQANDGQETHYFLL